MFAVFDGRGLRKIIGTRILIGVSGKLRGPKQAAELHFAAEPRGSICHAAVVFGRSAAGKHRHDSRQRQQRNTANERF